MSTALQVIVIICCLALSIYVLRLVSKERLLLKYSLLWLVLALLLLICALFPDTLFSLSRAIGFEAPSNFVFFIGLFCLLAIALSLSVIASKQTIKIKNLTQRIALIEYDMNHKDDELSTSGERAHHGTVG